jgi:hypothetical protein
MEEQLAGLNINDFLFRAIVNIIVTFIIVRFIYYPNHKNKEFLFTFILFNITIFFLCYLLISTKLELGFAFGLFAVFSMIRYRTVTIPVREMGYFFICVALGIVNALMTYGQYHIFLIGVNVFFILLIFLLDMKFGLKHENYKYIVYDKIDLINNKEALLEELKVKTGMDFHKIEIMKIDFFKELVRLKAYYYSNSIETYNESTDDDD